MPRSTRGARSRSILENAFLPVIRAMYTAGDPPAGGGSAPPVAPPVVPPVADADKVTLTKAELQSQIDAALATAQQKADAKAEKARKDAEAADAAKRGEFETLAKANEARAVAAENEAKALKRSIALRDHLADKHAEYVACAKYILPLIPADVEDDNLAKAIEEAATAYVKDNPRQAKGNPPAGPHQSRTANRVSVDRQQPVNRNVLPNGNLISSPSSRF